MNSRLRSLLGMITESLLPASCTVCNMALSTPAEIETNACWACTSDLVRLREPVCDYCGIPLSSEDAVCISCRQRGSALPFVDRLRSVFLYAASAPDLLHAYKTGGAKPLAGLWARSIAPLLEVLCSSDSIVAPVPSSPANVRRRGFDQVRLILQALPHQYLSKVDYDLLTRSSSRSQKKLSRDDRQSNLLGKVSVCKQKTLVGHVLLVDDICTTGATLSHCASLLIAAGASAVSAVTLFRD